MLFDKILVIVCKKSKFFLDDMTSFDMKLLEHLLDDKVK